MKLPLLLLFCFALSGCSMELSSREETSRHLKIQSARTLPSGAQSKMIATEQLMPGDLLLSSSTSVQSLGIRLFSLSGVSHASLYLGDNQVAEAVGSGVKLISLTDALNESNNLLVLRFPDMTPEQTGSVVDFARKNLSKKYNYRGIVMFAPYMITRRMCELPVMNGSLRQNCLSILATVQLGAPSPVSERYFCSEFVMEAYRHAGYPLFSGENNWISPADLLHIREGDVSSFKKLKTAAYVGHLKRWDLLTILGLRQPVAALPAETSDVFTDKLATPLAGHG